MKNIPSKEELIGYLKSGKKTISMSVGIFIILYLLLLAYSLYATYTELREEEEIFLTQEEMVEMLDREPEEVTPMEIRDIEEALEQERYAFGVLIEREDQTFYNYPALMTEFLISEEVVTYVEERIGSEILPSPELAVEVSEDSGTRIQEIVIGTGETEDNILIANAYYEAIQESDLIAPLSDKVIYMMDDEPFLVEEETWLELALEQIQLFSPARAVAGFIAMITLGFFTGIVLVLIKTFFSREVPFMYELKERDSDNVIYFNQMREIDERERIERMLHATLTFPELKKVILSQNKLSEEFEVLLREKIEEAGNQNVSLAQDVNNVPLNERFDEVVILVKQHETTKTWYKNQRIQLERLKLPVTILNY